jgi:hypothetical protein
MSCKYNPTCKFNVNFVAVNFQRRKCMHLRFLDIVATSLKPTSAACCLRLKFPTVHRLKLPLLLGRAGKYCKLYSWAI